MKLLLEHLKNNREALLIFSKLVSSASHSVNLGMARKSLIKNFIQTNLPEYINYHTGEVFDKHESRSGQIDIILHPISAPKIYLQNTISIFPAETVLAAIEVKSKLTTGKNKSSLHEALATCLKLKHLELSSVANPPSDQIVDAQRVPFILFAFEGPKLNTLRKHLAIQFGKRHITAREMPDLIVILDRGYYLTKSRGWMNAGITAENLYNETIDPDIVLLGLFQLVLKLVENWVNDPTGHAMPIKAYTEDMPASLFRFLS